MQFNAIALSLPFQWSTPMYQLLLVQNLLSEVSPSLFNMDCTLWHVQDSDSPVTPFLATSYFVLVLPLLLLPVAAVFSTLKLWHIRKQLRDLDVLSNDKVKSRFKVAMEGTKTQLSRNKLEQGAEMVIMLGPSQADVSPPGAGRAQLSLAEAKVQDANANLDAWRHMGFLDLLISSVIIMIWMTLPYVYRVTFGPSSAWRRAWAYGT